jgi:hypothetical protein
MPIVLFVADNRSPRRNRFMEPALGGIQSGLDTLEVTGRQQRRGIRRAENWPGVDDVIGQRHKPAESQRLLSIATELRGGLLEQRGGALEICTPSPCSSSKCAYTTSANRWW